MDTPTLIKHLMDPMGMPFYPAVFQLLMVLTFTLHILLVNATVGAAGLAVYGRLAGGPFWDKLSTAMAKTTTMSVSALIVLGVAPLLFVQVIYDPFWYASNLLSAAWVIAFVFIMMAGFSAAYLAYPKQGGAVRLAPAVAALLLFLAAGALMHGFGFQGLQPEKWLGWYSRAGGVDASGLRIHAFSWARFLHFIIPAPAVAGVVLMLRSWYLEPRADADRAHLDEAAKLGAALAFYWTVAECINGFWWLMVIPADLHFATDSFLMSSLVLSLLLCAYFARLTYFSLKPQDAALPSAAAMFVVTLGMCAARETLRMAYLRRYDYSPLGHRLALDWGSTALFFGTFVLGLSVLSYVLAVAFQSGRVAGRWTAGPRMRAWGKASLGLLVAWVVVVAGLGVVVTLRNRGL
ncbi:MAG: hypothetical protein HY079_04310 [Elusimicrobia bacterium]|nr:hypothetical protein [Elusimicrobiota bacterium]